MTDNEIRTELQKLDEKTPIAEAFNLAVELGASAAFIQELCCGSDYWNEEYQSAFLGNMNAWKMFGGEALASFLKRMAHNHPIELIRQITTIENRVGHTAAFEIVSAAASEVGYVSDDDSLRVIEGLPKSLRERVAMRVMADWRTIPFIVRTLKGRASYDWDYRRRLFFKDWVLTAPTSLRWAMLGGEKFCFPGNLLPPIENDLVDAISFGGSSTTWWKDLCLQAEEAGWQFAKLQRRMLNGKSELVAEVTNSGIKGGEKVIYVHNNNGARGDRLAEGDEVMVLKRPTETKIPVGVIFDTRKLVCQRIGNEIWVKPYELHPVKPPTAEMLRDPGKYFRGEDIPVTPKVKD